MNFKVGQRIIAVANGFNYGGRADSDPLLNHDYAIGWKGTMGDDNVIIFDNGRVIRGCDNNSFELINESEGKSVEANAIRRQATQYKVGTKVEIVHLREPWNYPSDFIGKQGVITKVRDYHDNFPVRIEVQGVSMSDYLNWYAEDEFKVIPETPQFTIGSKVTCVDGSYSMEFANGNAMDSNANICRESFDYEDYYVYEVTAINTKLPTRPSCKPEAEGTNNTIIRRISDGKVFFVQARFLKEYVATPKFKRGDWVQCSNGYYRVILSFVKDGIVYYSITSSPSSFVEGKRSNSITATEDIIKEVQ